MKNKKCGDGSEFVDFTEEDFKRISSCPFYANVWYHRQQDIDEKSGIFSVALHGYIHMCTRVETFDVFKLYSRRIRSLRLSLINHKGKL